MDCKFIGSGTAAYAMVEYVTNYIAKISLDSSAIFSCLCAALATIYKSSQTSMHEETSQEEKARLLLLKICNGMIGKRELSGQQVTSFLQNVPNRYTDHKFETFWWSSLLRFISREHFSLHDESDEEFVTIHDGNLQRTVNVEHNLPPLVANYLYRPAELSNLCLWDFWCEYKTCNSKKEDNESDELDTEIASKTYFFKDSHPKHNQIVLRPRKQPITPVMNGIQIPRSDKDPEDKERFEIIILTLFKPWSDDTTLLKENHTSWQNAYEGLYSTLTDEHKTLVCNFQAIHTCKDAADDFSKKRMKTAVNFLEPDTTGTDVRKDGKFTLVEDENWTNAMNIETEESDLITCDNILMEQFLTQSGYANVIDAVESATAAGFYNVSQNNWSSDEGLIQEGSLNDAKLAQTEFDMILKSEKKYNDEFPVSKEDWKKEYENDEPVQQLIGNENDPEKFRISLHPHRRLCLTIIDKLTLNDEQALAFLLFADRYGLQHCINSGATNIKPIRLLITGPGGTGKSQIFQAVKCFLQAIGHENKIKMTAPTGLAANNINGSTVHSEINLRIQPRDMLSNDAKGKKRRQNIENKYANTTIQVIDEIYFMSARDNALLSQYLKLANQTKTDQSYGTLNMIFAGDPAQLPPPKQMSLFDQHLVKDAEKKLNATSENATKSLSGVVVWHEISDCIVLSKIMRQKDPHFQNILNRLRFGNCTYEDYEKLLESVVENRSDSINKSLLDISLWVTNIKKASPLITYTNAVRDAHNSRCAEAFALYTGQPYHEYHAIDTVNRGKTILTNLAAKAAWNTSIKRAHDLAGKLPLIPEMPIFLTQNLATHLGLSNGGFGKLISAKYIYKDGLRYAISAVVDIERFNGGPTQHPHRLTIVPAKTNFTYELPGSSKTYTATRTQLPIIPAFAFTAHNAQSRSLDAACIDLESCPSTPAAYVMVSRLRDLSGLSILRPFSYKKISRHSAQETRNEVRRLDSLYANTLERCKKDLDWYYVYQSQILNSTVTHI